MSAEARIREMAQPLASRHGLDLVDVEIKGAGGSRLVRVVVDRKGGIVLRDCQELSTQLGALLEQEDPIEGRYALEVTSPGTDRALADREDFDRVEGRSVLVRRKVADGSVVELRGAVVGAHDDAVVVDTSDGEVRVPYEEIEKAKQTLPW